MIDLDSAVHGLLAGKKPSPEDHEAVVALWRCVFPDPPPRNDPVRNVHRKIEAADEPAARALGLEAGVPGRAAEHLEKLAGDAAVGEGDRALVGGVGVRGPVPVAVAVVGEVTDARKGVHLKSRIGGMRIVDMLSGEQLPRIC